MKKIIASVFLFFWAAYSVAAPNLLGTWVSDKTLTMQYNRQYSLQNAATFNFQEQLFGRAVMRFDASNMSIMMSDWDFKDGEKTTRMKGFQLESPYRVIASTEKTLIVQTLDATSGKAVFETYHFPSPDVFWFYAGNGEKKFADVHVREYYRRYTPGAAAVSNAQSANNTSNNTANNTNSSASVNAPASSPSTTDKPLSTTRTSVTGVRVTRQPEQ